MLAMNQGIGASCKDRGWLGRIKQPLPIEMPIILLAPVADVFSGSAVLVCGALLQLRPAPQLVVASRRALGRSHQKQLLPLVCRFPPC